MLNISADSIFIFLSKVKLSCYYHAGTKRERRYSSYSLTSALDGDEWRASRPGRALPPRNGLPVPIGQDPGWASEMVGTQRLEEKSFASAGDQTPDQSVFRHYTD
jgi:hypothetical protein